MHVDFCAASKNGLETSIPLGDGSRFGLRDQWISKRAVEGLDDCPSQKERTNFKTVKNH
jgi:hypothetical protein